MYHAVLVRYGEIGLSATTPVLPEIANRICLVMTKEFGNPSSLHNRGLAAENLVTEARKSIGQTLEIREKEITKDMDRLAESLRRSMKWLID